MRLHGVHHVSLNVKSVEEAAKFYLEVLGLEALPRPDLGFAGIWLGSGAQQLHLMEDPQHDASRSQHFAFRVEDIDAAVEELRERGVRVSRVMDVPGAGRQAFLRDPSGNLLELNQPGS
jgi:catechol 2,3-dioxygenase-like lactoylglutathione lyase family enzyme